MSVIGHSPLAGASGAASSGGGSFEGVYVDDLFSTFLYEGNSSTNVINNGIDLSGEGGLVWLKNRSTGNTYHYLCDTERGTERYLYTNGTGAEYYYANNGVTSFNSNGFTVKGTSDWFGLSEEKICSWTFRKQSKFFDVVTYNGTGSAQNISHSLGSVPGMIIIHCRDGSHDWEVYHRSTGATKSLHLNKTDSAATDSTVWNNTTPTSSVFTVGTSSNVNQNGHGYVAYIFAHDDQSFGTNGDESIIKCGSYTGDSNGEAIVNLGFEPQFLITKRTNNTSNWEIVDVMRGLNTNALSAGTVDNQRLFANLANSESGFPAFGITSTGFLTSGNIGSGNSFIYMAIRRPHKPPTAGTEVFVAQASRSAADGTPSELTYTSNFPVDLMFNIGRAGNSLNMVAVERLRGEGYLSTSQLSAENPSSPWRLDTNAGVYLNGSYGATSDHGGLMFRRAAGVFDIVNYTGDGTTSRNISHNLGVFPELVIIKRRSQSGEWWVDADAAGSGKVLYLNRDNAAFSYTAFGTHTTTTIQLETVANNDTNHNTSTHVAYLFATLDGISKVGSYSGTGSNVNVSCGFTAGARFVLIKRTDSTGDWYFWDTARGIVSGNDPYLLFNSTAAEVTNTDYIDPLNAGFTVTSSAPAALNASGGTYLFLAIA